MITFKQFLMEQTSKNPIPMGKYDNERGNFDHIIIKIENMRSVPTKTIDVKQLVDTHKLFATQSWLSNEGGGDPVFPDLEDYPVVAQDKGLMYIIDGHHRMARAYRNNQKLKVYMA